MFVVYLYCTVVKIKYSLKVFLQDNAVIYQIKNKGNHLYNKYLTVKVINSISEMAWNETLISSKYTCTYFGVSSEPVGPFLASLDLPNTTK